MATQGASEKKWICLIDNEEVGPLTKERVKELAGSGKIARDTLIRRKGKSKWCQAHTFKGLKDYFDEPGYHWPLWDPSKLGSRKTSPKASGAGSVGLSLESTKMVWFKMQRWAGIGLCAAGGLALIYISPPASIAMFVVGMAFIMSSQTMVMEGWIDPDEKLGIVGNIFAAVGAVALFGILMFVIGYGMALLMG